MLTKGELIWGPMMRMSGPPAFSELDLLIMATCKRTLNSAVESLLNSAELMKKHYNLPPLHPLTVR